MLTNLSHFLMSVQNGAFCFIMFFLTLSGVQFINAQDYYSTAIYSTLDQDPAYQKLLKKENSINREFLRLKNKMDPTPSEKAEIDLLLKYVSLGMDSTEIIMEKDTVIKNILIRNDISPTNIYEIKTAISDLKEQKSRFKSLYALKSNINHTAFSNYLNSKFLQNEVKRYKLNNNIKILEIGAGENTAAKAIGKEVKNSAIYLNDIDTFILKKHYTLFQVDEDIEKIEKRRNNSYHFIKGTDSSTRAESITFDVVLIRNTLHHFKSPELMLNSIKRSMNEGSRLILREVVKSNCRDNCCPSLMSIEKIEELMLSNDLIESNRQKVQSGNNSDYLLLTYKLKQEN